MYSNIKRDSEYISYLLSFIHREYGFEAIDLMPAKRGFYGETWRLDTTAATYFLKLVYASEHINTYKRSFPLIQHLCDHGIDYISQIIKAKNGNFYTEFDGAILGVFNWINGELTETDETKVPEYQMLAKVYTVPTDGVCIPREDFSGSISDVFYKQWESLNDSKLLALLEKNRGKIEHRAQRLKQFAILCQLQIDNTPYFITHGDAGGNLIVGGDKHFLVDWDNPLLAPPERDAWVMCSKNWAREAFQTALHDNGIKHTLRTECLAYYCYNFFFYYLTAFLDASTNADTVEEYIDGWIKNSINYCENWYDGV